MPLCSVGYAILMQMIWEDADKHRPKVGLIYGDDGNREV